MEERFGLDGRSVLEVGCFEGVYTVGLARRGADVLATDARVENVVKTAVPCAFFDVRARFGVWDVERRGIDLGRYGADLVHHVGVLYHLADPVPHLHTLVQVAQCGIMLDTHVARDEEATERLVVDGRECAYRRYLEHGRNDVFSGMADHAKWLRLDDIVAILEGAAFDVDVAEMREERHGRRVLLFARRAQV